MRIHHSSAVRKAFVCYSGCALIKLAICWNGAGQANVANRILGFLANKMPVLRGAGLQLILGCNQREVMS